MVTRHKTSAANVLFVDDDQDLLRLVAFNLDKWFGERIALTTESVPTTAEGLLAEKNFDLLVTDLQMVGKNGFHLLKTAKQHDPLIQVIIVTAHDSGNAVRSALAMGADEFFTKPLDPKELVSSVEYLLNRIQRWRANVPELGAVTA